MVKIAGRTLLEIVVLMAVSAAVGLGVNTVRHARKDKKHAVVLNRNYFVRASVAQAVPPAGSTAEASSQSARDSAASIAGAHLGVHRAKLDEVRGWFEDPKLVAGLHVFVDARDQGLFDAGRIPGALLVDHYRSDQYLPEALSFILPAERVIVYCNGGDCEDSIFLAQTLIENGIEPDRIYVFEGGFEEWEAQGMPVEKTEPPS